MHDNGGLYKGNRDGDETWLEVRHIFKTVLKNILVHWRVLVRVRDDDRKTAIKMGRFEREKGLTSPITPNSN